MNDLKLLSALTALAIARTPAKVTDYLRTSSQERIYADYTELSATIRSDIERRADSLAERRVDVLTCLDPEYPNGLIQRGRPVAPLLFYKGDASLFHRSGVGMCGSRHASPLGLKAARACGDEVSKRRLTVVSGYAAGVDTETHLAALDAGGATVIVLAEGIDHFKVKREFKESFDPTRVLVVSQFGPTQPWAAHAAMSRNKTIYGLGRALVVVEAGGRGGTLAAGEGALAIDKPVFVLNFGHDTPEGNARLLAAGGRAISSRADLGDALVELGRPNGNSIQLRLDV